MLNENDLAPLLKVSLPPLHISDIHWKAQNSTRNSIFFYKINPDEKSQQLFTERLEKSDFGWLVVNTDHPSKPVNSSVLPLKEWPVVQKKILDKLYPLPDLKLFAVTGTNGKTTTAELILQLGELCGKRGMSIGTLGVRELHQTLLDFGMTSPGLIDLRKFLHLYGKDKDFCVLEASSHALAQERFYGLKFEQGGWLSFSQDHLDYHKTMEEYFAAKLLLFKYLNSSGSIFVPKSEQQLYSRLLKVTKRVKLARKIENNLPLFFSTSFNRSNLEVAVEVIEHGFKIKVPEVFHQIKPPEGRFYIRPYQTSFIVVDFAHTPDALENICRAIKESFPAHGLKILFGCGGERDRGKRAQMGKIAQTWGSKVYVTTDNPRSENPALIIEDIVADMPLEKFVKVIERPEAVRLAFSELGSNEVLLLAGKGHEDHILKNSVKYPYSDIEEVEKFLGREKI